MTEEMSTDVSKPRLRTQDLTIYVPTKNRTEFLHRVLHYYSLTEFQGILFIGDSSEGISLEENRRLIRQYGQSLNISVWELPGVGQGHAAARLVEEIDTPYSTLLCDDDLILTPSIEKALMHLNNNSDVAGVNGQSIFFSVKEFPD